MKAHLDDIDGFCRVVRSPYSELRVFVVHK